MSEHDEQAAVVAWAAYKAANYPDLELLYAIPNGGARHTAVGGKLKAEGVKAGVPDLHLPVAAQGYHSLYIELKAVKGRVSAEQAEWHKRLTVEGHRVVVFRGCEAACREIADYLGIALDEWEWLSAR